MMTPENDERFPKSVRLVSRVDFDRVFNEGLVASDSVLVIHACVGKAAWTRIGLSLSKRVGDAPTRNLWKRLLRESFRKQKHQLPPGLDIVARPKRGAKPDYQAIYESLPRLVRQLNKRLKREHP